MRSILIGLTLIFGFRAFVFCKPNEESHWYQNERFGYRFKVPVGFKASELPNCDPSSTCLQSIIPESEEGHSIGISIYTDNGSHDCKRDPSYYLTPEKKKINDIEFSRFKVTGAGAGQRWHEVWYVVAHNDLCYSIDLFSDRDFNDPVPLRDLITTFSFTEKK